jgi:transposase
MSDRFEHTLEHTLESKADEPGDTGLVRRIEVITGTGRRRQWSEDEKARIVIESLKTGANVSEVARRNGVSPQQLFGWRRDARALMAESIGVVGVSVREPAPAKAPEGEHFPAGQLPAFAPVVVATCGAPPSAPPATPPCGHIEIAIGDAIVRVVGLVEAPHLTTVLRAVRRAV